MDPDPKRWRCPSVPTGTVPKLVLCENFMNSALGIVVVGIAPTILGLVRRKNLSMKQKKRNIALKSKFEHTKL